jgi:hypothetical protein
VLNTVHKKKIKKIPLLIPKVQHFHIRVGLASCLRNTDHCSKNFSYGIVGNVVTDLKERKVIQINTRIVYCIYTVIRFPLN